MMVKRVFGKQFISYIMDVYCNLWVLVVREGDAPKTHTVFAVASAAMASWGNGTEAVRIILLVFRDGVKIFNEARRSYAGSCLRLTLP